MLFRAISQNMTKLDSLIQNQQSLTDDVIVFMKELSVVIDRSGIDIDISDSRQLVDLLHQKLRSRRNA